jgi:hypothetical protein
MKCDFEQVFSEQQDSKEATADTFSWYVLFRVASNCFSITMFFIESVFSLLSKVKNLFIRRIFVWRFEMDWLRTLLRSLPHFPPRMVRLLNIYFFSFFLTEIAVMSSRDDLW